MTILWRASGSANWAGAPSPCRAAAINWLQMLGDENERRSGDITGEWSTPARSSDEVLVHLPGIILAHLQTRCLARLGSPLFLWRSRLSYSPSEECAWSRQR